MIEQNGANPYSGRGLEINETRSIWGEHSPKQKGCILFADADASEVQVDYVVEGGLIELHPFQCRVAREHTSLGGEPVWIDRTKKDRLEALRMRMPRRFRSIM